MAWETLKWDPSKEKFRRVAKELGYDVDDNLKVFNCCVPSSCTYNLEVPPQLKKHWKTLKELVP